MISFKKAKEKKTSKNYIDGENYITSNLLQDNLVSYNTDK